MTHVAEAKVKSEKEKDKAGKKVRGLWRRASPTGHDRGVIHSQELIFANRHGGNCRRRCGSQDCFLTRIDHQRRATRRPNPIPKMTKISSGRGNLKHRAVEPSPPIYNRTGPSPRGQTSGLTPGIRRPRSKTILCSSCVEP